jgi:SAM-dependent methyltransferase
MLFRFNRASRIEIPPNPCAICGYRGAVFTREKATPDFNLKLLPRRMRGFFKNKMNGVCVSCGTFQAFNRPDAETVAAVNSIGKDATSSWDGMKSYPVEQRFIDEFEARHLSKRKTRWDEYFKRVPIAVRKALVIRTWFGSVPLFVKEYFGAEVSGIDMSEACIRTTADRVPGFQKVDGFINHAFEGPFLSSGPYDAVFIFHVLTHSCDYRKMLNQIKGLLAPGGFLLLTHEAVKKPTNPFHMMHLGEFQLVSILRDHFDRVDRIDDCGTAHAPHITDYSLKGDEPDFVAWLKPQT